MTLPTRGAKTGKQENNAGWAVPARRIAASAGAGLALLALLLCAAAAVCLKFDVARERMYLIAIPLAGLAAFAAGYLNVLPVRRQGLALGALAAAALYLPVLAAALLVSRAAPGVNAVLLLLVMLLGGAGGGIFAANHAASSRKSAKARKR